MTGKPLVDIPTEWESDLDEIFGRYLLYWEAFLIAAGLPLASPNYEPLVDLSGQELYSDIAADLDDFRERGLVLVVPEGSITDHVLRLPNPSPLAKEEGREVVIQDCWVNDLRFENLDGEAEFSSFESLLRNVTMKVVGGEWRVWASIDATEESSGYQECRDYIDEL